MAHRFTFTVAVELERVSGKFASRDEMADEIYFTLGFALDALAKDLGADGDSAYEITDWTVEES